MKVRKAVITAAGFGTRFLPASRSVPKVMLPVFDTPVISLAVKEAADAGIEHVTIIMSPHQESIGSYFGRMPDLEEALKRQGKEDLLERMLGVSEMVEIRYVLQDVQLGLGHAILTARSVVGEEPFAVFLPDDVIWSDTPTISRMIELFGEFNGPVIAVKEVPDESVPSLGIVEHRPVSDSVYEVVGMVEKPRLAEAPSNLAIIGRYVLPPEIFETLARTPAGALGEIQLTDAVSALLSTQKVYAYQFPGAHFDVGTPLGLLKASVYAALQTEGPGEDLRRWLGEI